jgi:receptor expression-enhancing protein 5/6
VTVLYPAVHSIRAIESEDEDDDKVWLTYWMVFGVFNVIETFFGVIFWFIPYWGWIRPGFFVWLILPQFNGSRVIYESVLQPLLSSQKDLIEKYT